MVARDRIVIGASAGGVSTLQHLVAGFPPDLPASVFITLHVFERSEPIMPELLNRAGPLKALPAKEGAAIRNGCIYVAPPDHHLLLDKETVHLGHGPREGLQRPSINVMFRSAAASFGERVSGVVLTGMLDDGAAGLWEIQQRGGATIVQDPEEAAYRSMPDCAIRGLNVQYILRQHEIAPLLTRLTMGDQYRTQEATQPVISALTRQACPECGGVMKLEQHGELKEYTCHVGHRLGLQTMILEKAAMVERTMWTTLSQSEELMELLKQAATQAEPALASSIDAEVAERERDIAAIRAILERNKISPLAES